MTELNQEELDQKEQEREAQVKEQQHQAAIETEQKAKDSGWVPKEDFRGDPKLWRPASEWNERAETLMPIMKATNKRLEETVSSQTKELSEMKDMVGRMVKVQEKHSGDLYDGRITDLETQKRKAVEDGDTALYDRLVEQGSAIVKPELVKVEESTETAPPGMDWMQENAPWFGTDPEMTDAAVFIGEQMAARQDPLAIKGNEVAMAQEVKRRVQALYPDKFKNPNQNRGDGMDEPNVRGGDDFIQNDGDKGWNDLPETAKQHCASMIKSIPGFTKEKYVEDYDF